MESKNLKQSPIIFILLLALLVAGGFSYWYIKSKNDSRPISIPVVQNKDNQISNPMAEPKEIKHFLSTKQQLEFDYPDLFGLSETNDRNKIILASLYYVLPDPTNAEISSTTQALPPHYLSMYIEKRSLSLQEAMKQENPYFAETYLNTKTNAKKPIPDYPMELKKIAGLDAYSFPIGAEGFNSRYTYIAKNENETIVIIQDWIGEFLKDIAKPKFIAESEQQKAFDTILQSLQIK